MSPKLRPTRSYRRLRGFTFAELIVVLTIVGILAGIAVPRYANFLSNHRVDAAVNRIIADLALAQHQAQLTGTSQSIKFNVTGNSYTLADFPDPDHAGFAYRASLWDDPYQASIISAVFDSDAILVFDAYGVPDSGGSVVVRVGRRQLTITVNSVTGQPSVGELQVVPSEIIDPKPDELTEPDALP